jgi:methylated-DNA-protein-cysteine methyltransferase-like protein
VDSDFIGRVYAVVSEIPYGQVATYGQIARLSGYDRNARQVGRVLANADYDIPCHRVINSSGKTAPHFLEQKRLLEEEGVIFKENGHIDLKKYQWDM